MERFDEAHFFDLEDRYSQAVSDLSTTYLTLQVGDRKKSVQNYWHSGRHVDPWGHEVRNWQIHESLDALADAIDRSVNIEQWIGTESERWELFRSTKAGRPGGPYS